MTSNGSLQTDASPEQRDGHGSAGHSGRRGDVVHRGPAARRRLGHGITLTAPLDRGHRHQTRSNCRRGAVRRSDRRPSSAVAADAGRAGARGCEVGDPGRHRARSGAAGQGGRQPCRPVSRMPDDPARRDDSRLEHGIRSRRRRWARPDHRGARRRCAFARARGRGESRPRAHKWAPG